MSGLARKGSLLLAGALAAATTFSAPALASTARAASHPTAAPALTQVSTDPYTDAQAQHATEVEPDTFGYGSTVVSAFQVGRVSGGGASNIGWATSTDGGQTWTHGFMPSSTTNTGGSYVAASDASVAYDAKDGVWLVSWLGITSGSDVDVVVSRSTDGGHTWGGPVVVSTGTFDDKNWTVCDDHAASPYYGHCYTEYDDANSGDAEHMRTSADGGLTWGAEGSPADSPSGLGGQPVVQPSGTVIVPFSSGSSNAEDAFTSTDGGASWTASVQIAAVSHHTVAGLENDAAANDIAKLPHDTLRESPLPSAEIDASGKVYTVWSDCSFRANCASNDIIMSTSTDGTTWSTPVRVPIDPVTSTADHFTAGIGVDPSSSGGTARLGLTYYYYPNANCTDTTCQLDAGFVSSADGGSTWSTPVQLAGPMTLAWLPNTSQGRMFGDYISTSVLAGGNAVPVIPIAHAPNGSTFDVAMYSPTGGLPVGQATGGNTVTVTSPGNQTTSVGTAVSLQLSGTDSASGQSLSYSATGLPAGLSVSAAGLITGTPTTAGTSNVTVKATDGTGASGQASFTWTVNPVGGCTAPGQLLGNPGFETGTASPWTATAGVINNDTVSERAHSGSWDAWLDGYGSTHTDTLAQTVTVPAGCSATLSFYLHIDTAETTTTKANDTLKVQIGSTTLATYSNLNAGNGYTLDSFNLSGYAGQTVTLKFTGTENASLQTSFVIDDTALTVS
ncbi:putative Ig domain-containing protein [Kitasatospora viridis]|uniref:BNR repeat protein n=1 Tax=Kitasatospora viridis TaxID=281105 RepID=A0A561T683_9ACTN|nr:putative Ig domain-containing protein [Kitasatospora viridis]TWF82625.1 BNR repeat protein [Kitasatospora viridis]